MLITCTFSEGDRASKCFGDDCPANVHCEYDGSVVKDTWREYTGNVVKDTWSGKKGNCNRLGCTHISVNEVTLDFIN